ncbi:hypothetical protein [Nonomuraea bangladeshensis]|uniref:hypothetical protein n=1 Tax=Nonomuraea bangladeshensis TaxID=404385 RepID=UPI003C2CB51E
MTSIEEVTPGMLAELARHFGNGAHCLQEHGWTGPQRTPVIYEVAPPLRFQLDGFTGSRNMVGTDGSVSPDSEHAGYAAVHADGYVTVGTFTGPDMNCQTAEMQAVRYALRRSGEGPVTLLLDNQETITAVQRMARTGRLAAGCCRDEQAVAEVRDLLRLRPVTVRHVPDIEGTTTWDRLPSNPLMAAAHRLAWTARRMRVDGIALEGEAADWLRMIAAAGLRRTSTLRRRYESFRRTLANESGEAS